MSLEKEIAKQKVILREEYENEKHLFRNFGHFIDIKIFELSNDIDRVRDNLTVEDVEKLIERHNAFFGE